MRQIAMKIGEIIENHISKPATFSNLENFDKFSSNWSKTIIFDTKTLISDPVMRFWSNKKRGRPRNYVLQLR